MYPVLTEFSSPEFLQSFFGASIKVNSYGFLIAFGALMGTFYTGYQAQKKFDFSFDKVYELLLLLVLAAFIGGKVFTFFEAPAQYLANPISLITGKGFVFFGSLLFCIPSMIYYFKRNNLPVLPMVDVMATTTCIVHLFGRLGCFMVGCCYGVKYEGIFAVMYTNEACAAPLNSSIHPTQLYSVFLLLLIIGALEIVRRFYHKFDGQLFLTYLVLYSIGRSFIELFRGDSSRGYVIEDVLSHAQFVALLIILISAIIYVKVPKNRWSKPC